MQQSFFGAAAIMDDDVAAIRAFYESAGPDVFKYADALVDEGFDKLPSLPRVPRPLSMHAAPPSPTRGWSVWSGVRLRILSASSALHGSCTRMSHVPLCTVQILRC